MKHLLLALLLLAAAPAGAEQICAPWGNTTDFVFTNTESDAALTPPCVPSWAGGTGIGAVAWNLAGASWYVYCPTKYAWRGHFGAITHETAAERASEIPAFLASTDRPALLASWVTKYGIDDITGPALLPVWCPFVAARQAARPPNPRYTVTTNGTSLTRPTRIAVPTTTGYALGGTGALRVAVGAPCRCDRIAIEGSPLYCRVLDAELVAVCRAAP